MSWIVSWIVSNIVLLSSLYPYPVTVQRFPGFFIEPRAGKQTKQTASLSSTGVCSLRSAMSDHKYIQIIYNNKSIDDLYRYRESVRYGCDVCK